MKTRYKLVVKSHGKIFVKKRSKNKSFLEEEAMRLSKNKPHWTLFVVSEDTIV